MFILKKAVINKYKSYTKKQEVILEDDITTLVGKNESGKTAFLEALAKFNYFSDDKSFTFDETHDYPRNEYKKYQKAGESVKVIECTFQLDENTINAINDDLGKKVLLVDTFTVSKNYGNNNLLWSCIKLDEKEFINSLKEKLDINDETFKELESIGSVAKIVKTEGDEDENEELSKIISYLQDKIADKAYGWDNLLAGYVTKQYLSPHLPRLLYFDEYYELPSRVSLDNICNDETSETLTHSQLETAKALIELSGIDINELTNSNDFESFKAELEATSNEITDQMFQYWKTNDQLSVEFDIHHKPRPQQNISPEKILDIRIKNLKHRVSLPLKNRSKGFNWFFSFLVWFSKIQDEKDRNFILLLDEPGLNLHASAQADLLRFIEDLSNEYQIIYTTHSPFMVESKSLQRVRTVYDSDKGSIISDAIQEKDPDTLFPLQAALGYDIAQNLFVSKKNLLVEGPSDLNYLTYMSNLLTNLARVGLNNDITIVPVGGLDKISTFVSLLRGSKLKIACLLDSFNNKGKQKLYNLVKNKIIRDKDIRFFDEFADENCNKADMEDLFNKSEYLEIFKTAYPEHKKINLADLDENKCQILPQLNSLLDKKHFNHYKPSQSILGMDLPDDFFSSETLDRFENMFKEINGLF